ncbi:alpha/beta hydrolase [uncultured Amphritea sp.]|uniref:alpha/beta hydrolase n=1 Tax=uncultured Amphritea sp. TaxID=981605 RepID=UPI0025E1C45C|nr:alpha/beta hydrolase [uncultured Amphritea sp.]
MLLSACSVAPSGNQRLAAADEKAEVSGWQGETFQAGQFLIRSYFPAKLKKAHILTIYIEGDGLAWLTRIKPSPDPTPIAQLVLEMAISQPSGSAVYLGRPCQYTVSLDSGCRSVFWLDSRFSQEIIASMDRAVTVVKNRFQADLINLVGYSGGGAVASLLAARREDVNFLITVAGNLDHQSWSRIHRITPLGNSLNPADFSDRVRANRQFHFVGEDDHNIPPYLIREKISRMPDRNNISVIEVHSYTHRCCWSAGWPYLWSKLPRND